MQPIKVVVSIDWDSGANEEVELDVNDKLEIKHKGMTLSVRGELKVDEKDEE